MVTKKLDIAKAIMDHVERDNIISKLAMGISPKEISEYLCATYDSVGERALCLSEKTIQKFYDDYFDFYKLVRDDAAKLQQQSPSEQLSETLQNNVTYKKALEQYTNEEIDIRSMIKRAVASVETRTAYVFDLIAEDPENTRPDRTLIEWFRLLLDMAKEYETIQTGNVENNISIGQINIQMVDRHIDVVLNIVREILSELDYDLSMKFMDRFNEEIQKLKQQETVSIKPIEARLEEAKHFVSMSDKLLK